MSGAGTSTRTSLLTTILTLGMLFSTGCPVSIRMPGFGFGGGGYGPGAVPPPTTGSYGYTPYGSPPGYAGMGYPPGARPGGMLGSAYSPYEYRGGNPPAGYAAGGGYPPGGGYAPMMGGGVPAPGGVNGAAPAGSLPARIAGAGSQAPAGGAGGQDSVRQPPQGTPDRSGGAASGNPSLGVGPVTPAFQPAARSDGGRNARAPDNTAGATARSTTATPATASTPSPTVSPSSYWSSPATAANDPAARPVTGGDLSASARVTTSNTTTTASAGRSSPTTATASRGRGGPPDMFPGPETPSVEGQPLAPDPGPSRVTLALRDTRLVTETATQLVQMYSQLSPNELNRAYTMLENRVTQYSPKTLETAKRDFSATLKQARSANLWNLIGEFRSQLVQQDPTDPLVVALAADTEGLTPDSLVSTIDQVQVKVNNLGAAKRTQRDPTLSIVPDTNDVNVGN